MKENFVSVVLFTIIGTVSFVAIFLCNNSIVINVAVSVFAGSFLAIFLAIINYIAIKKRFVYNIKTIHNEFEHDVKFFILVVWKHQNDYNLNFWRESILKLYDICKKEQNIIDLWNEFDGEFYPLFKQNKKIKNEAIILFEEYHNIFNINSIYELYYGDTINIEDTKKYIISLLNKVMIKIEYKDYNKYSKYPFVIYTESKYTENEDRTDIYAIRILAELQDLIKSLDKL